MPTIHRNSLVIGTNAYLEILHNTFTVWTSKLTLRLEPDRDRQHRDSQVSSLRVLQGA